MNDSVNITRICNLYGHRQLGISIEIFPPKTSGGDATLHRTLEKLAEYEPGFISCTYGAGGTTRTRTLDWCADIQSRYRCTATAHFTCVGSTRDELREWLDLARGRGIQNIMALRGDTPQGESTFQPVPGGLRYANELVALIRDMFPDLGIGVAGYPEKHTECDCPVRDLENLKRKVDAGADAVFTQLFYENENFFRFRDEYERLGISVPLIPGIMPITEFARIQRITSMCGAQMPTRLADELEAVQDDKSAQFEIGVNHAIQQCQELVAAGVPGIHFYVLNKSSACERILDSLGLEPTRAECA